MSLVGSSDAGYHLTAHSSGSLPVYLHVVLGAGLAIFCFCLIVGCALCWRRGKHRDPTGSKGLGSERIVLETNAGLLGNTSTPVKQQYEEVEGSVLDYPPCVVSHLQDSGHPCQLGPHGRPSLPFIPVIPKPGLNSKTKRILERRCTVSGDISDYKEPVRLGSSVPKPLGSPSQNVPDSFMGMKTKPKPLLHFTLFYSSYELNLTVSIIGIYNLPRRFGTGCDSYVRVHLLPKILEPRQTAVRRKSLNPEFRESFQFSGHTPEEIKCFTLRFAVYVKEFHNLKDSFVGELFFPLEQLDWKLDVPSTHTMGLSATKTKLKKCLSTQDVASGAAPPKLLGQLFVLLQYQTLANRIKVMVRKAETLARLTRMPGSPDHYVIINLYKDGKTLSSKVTKTSSGYNPVWNAPFLFDVPPGDIESLDLSLEFIIMQFLMLYQSMHLITLDNKSLQKVFFLKTYMEIMTDNFKLSTKGRIYTRSSALGRVVISADASETGRMHWKEMASRGHVESARWHTIQPDAF